MVVAALKSLTWATVAGAVLSALLLAYGGSNMPRIAGIGADALRARPASTASPGRTPERPAAAAMGGAAPLRETSAH